MAKVTMKSKEQIETDRGILFYIHVLVTMATFDAEAEKVGDPNISTHATHTSHTTLFHTYRLLLLL